ncbi:MAG: hypothetical protein ACM3VZ_09420 [Acidobacteriota bacterium]
MSVLACTLRAAALVVVTLASVSVQAQPVWKDGVLTDPAGRMLYTFDKDQANQSHCAGGCLQAWPAYVAGADGQSPVLQGLSRFEQNGAQQWAWNGHPLYYFAGDAKPGDRNGDGKGGVWHIVQPPAPSTPNASASSY